MLSQRRRVVCRGQCHLVMDVFNLSPGCLCPGFLCLSVCVYKACNSVGWSYRTPKCRRYCFHYLWLIPDPSGICSYSGNWLPETSHKIFLMSLIISGEPSSVLCALASVAVHSAVWKPWCLTAWYSTGTTLLTPSSTQRALRFSHFNTSLFIFSLLLCWLALWQTLRMVG